MSGGYFIPKGGLAPQGGSGGSGSRYFIPQGGLAPQGSQTSPMGPSGFASPPAAPAPPPAAPATPPTTMPPSTTLPSAPGALPPSTQPPVLLQQEPPEAPQTPEKDEPQVGTAATLGPNQATEYCLDQGGEHFTTVDETGQEVGWCRIGGEECDEWDFYSGGCGPQPKQNTSRNIFIGLGILGAAMAGAYFFLGRK